MPLHPVAIELLRATGPLAVTSANVAGAAPRHRLAEAPRSSSATPWPIYLDAGALPDRPPSTIVDLTGPVPRLLRAGARRPRHAPRGLPEIVPG